MHSPGVKKGLGLGVHGFSLGFQWKDNSAFFFGSPATGSGVVFWE